MEFNFIVLLLLLAVYYFVKRYVNHSLVIFLEFIIMLMFFNHKVINFELKQFVFIAVGYFLSSFLTSITNLIVKGSFIKPDIKIPLNNLHIVTGIWEEVFWRSVVFTLMSKSFIYFSNHSLNLIFVVLFSSLVFVVIHKYKSTADYVEMYLFTLCLTVTAIYIPYMNVGLHIGRNCFILKLQEKKDREQIQKSDNCKEAS
ncbi:hypothetical protein J2Z32_002851 [Paenibacillus turicensis]|uniref:CAAX prenyl protease 2/Lysostaphin resistance protein A-like domain-containing protein n=1 Tax=Paenibacillus turicensis TaxID=160487 RepID=A0ABS4FUE6_9BACL|nr:hypothetical protein [Paenibacillus turicensis]